MSTVKQDPGSRTRSFVLFPKFTENMSWAKQRGWGRKIRGSNWIKGCSMARFLEKHRDSLQPLCNQNSPSFSCSTPNALIGMATSAAKHGVIARVTPGPLGWKVRARERVGRGSFYSFQSASPSSPEPQTASLVLPPWDPLPGRGEHCRLLITDLRAKLIFSSDRDVPLKNDFNSLIKVEPLAQAVQQTTTTTAASRTSHEIDTSELYWLKLWMSCPSWRKLL